MMIIAKGRQARWEAQAAKNGTTTMYHGTTLKLLHKIVNNGLSADQRKTLCEKTESWQVAQQRSRIKIAAASDGDATALWQHAELGGEVVSCVAICEALKMDEEKKERSEDDVRVVGLLIWAEPQRQGRMRLLVTLCLIPCLIACWVLRPSILEALSEAGGDGQSEL